MDKKYTILVIPEGTKDVKRFHLPPFVFPLFLLILLGSLGMAGYWFHQYRALGGQLPDLVALKQQNQRQEAQLRSFAGRLESFKTQMDGLKDFNQRLRVMANLEKPKEGQALFGMGGTEVQAGGAGVRLFGTKDERRLMKMQREIDQLQVDAEAQRQIQKELAAFLRDRHSVLEATPSIWPVRGWVTSGFGHRVSPFTSKRQFHSGLDISTRTGTPVVSPAEGVVTFAGWDGAFGRMLVLNHGHGLVTRYGHLRKFNVKTGQKVKRGQIVALVGSSGRSSGPHLHYEILLSGVPTNPRNYIFD